MNCRQRLLILSCSQRKNARHRGICQQLKDTTVRYFLFYVVFFVNAHVRQSNWMFTSYLLPMDLYRGDFPTPLYDQKMNMSRVVELHPQIKTTFSDILRNDYTSICFVLGKTYLKAFESLQDMIPIITEPIVAHGSIGKKQVQLKRWLWRNTNDR